MNQTYISEKHKSAIISATIALRKHIEDLKRLMIEGKLQNILDSKENQCHYQRKK